MTTRTKPPLRFDLTTPADWRHSDLTFLDAADRTAIDTAMARLGLERRFDGQVDHVHEMVRDALRNARAAGAVEAYVFQRTIEGHSLCSTLVVSVSQAETAQDHEDIDFLALRVQLEPLDGGVLSRDVSIECLPLAGEAVCIATRRDLGTGQSGEPATAVELQYLVPLPSSGAVVGLTFATANETVADAFRGLWRSIAATLQFVDPLTPGEARGA